MVKSNDELVRNFVSVERVNQAAGVGVSRCTYLNRGSCEAEKALVERFPIVPSIGLTLLLQQLVRASFEGSTHRFSACDMEQSDPDIQVALIQSRSGISHPRGSLSVNFGALEVRLAT